MARPRAVIRPSASTAPRVVSVSRATVSAAGGGGSGSASPAPSGVPQAASSRANPVRSAVAISGSGWGASRAWVASDQHR
ncbi:hypothetical protein B0E53_04782 [Micromonospora sp. MH33]|nr:hypothetical protein B0E53_04782 [Micromonospora sp. MH33]